MTDRPGRRLSRALPSGDRLDQPREQRATFLPRVTLSQEAFGVPAQGQPIGGGSPGLSGFTANWMTRYGA